MPLRVLLDATAVPPDRGGVGRYLDGLVPALAARDVELVITCQIHDADSFAPYAVEVVAPPARRIGARPTRLVWEQLGLPRIAARHSVDVVHSPHYTMPRRSPVPVVVTLHDATFFTVPEVHTRVKGAFFRTATRTALRRAAGCIVVSRASADEFARTLSVAPERMTVAHLGVDHDRFRPPDPDAVTTLCARLELGDEPYVAFLGTHEPRKNLPALIAGFAIAARDRRATLVLAGGRGWDDRIDSAIAAIPDVRIRRPGYLPLDDLPAYLGGATVVAYPSLDEGFGLPVLEAMACGAAVLTTRRGALPEVGGPAVAYTEVDPASIGTALGELLDDRSRRDTLGAAAVERARGFSWSACADAHIEAYAAAAGGRA